MSATVRMSAISRFAKAAALACVVFWTGPGSVLAQGSAPPRNQPATARPAQIDRNGVLILIRSTLSALQQANETGNYTVLRDLAAPGFRDANDAARLSEIFASQRAQKLDLSGVAVLDPQLTLMPQIEPNGLLHMSGFFPSAPSQINFELLFAPVEGRWRVFGIAVSLGTSTPAAPQASDVPSSAPAQASATSGKPEAQKPAGKPTQAAPRRAIAPSERAPAPESQPSSP